MFSEDGHLGSSILDLLIFPKPLESTKIEEEVIKSIK